MVTIRLLLFCAIMFQAVPSGAQEIKKEKIHLLFQKNDGNKPYYRGLKFVNEKGINFNLLENEGLIHRKKHSRDTLALCRLKNYHITKEDELKEKEKKWREENEAKLKEKYYGNFYKMIDKNSVFDTYIIEKIGDDKMVVYQVEFRNEGAVP